MNGDGQAKLSITYFLATVIELGGVFPKTIVYTASICLTRIHPFMLRQG